MSKLEQTNSFSVQWFALVGLPLFSVKYGRERGRDGERSQWSPITRWPSLNTLQFLETVSMHMHIYRPAGDPKPPATHVASSLAGRLVYHRDGSRSG